MKSNLNLRSSPWILICVFLVLTAGILIAGHFYYQSQKNKIIYEAQEMTYVILIVALIILAIASTFGFLWRHQHARYYREKYQAEQERQALISHFDYLFKYANDIIVLADKDLNIIEANDRALEMYGCMRSELIGLNVSRLQAPQIVSQQPERIRSLDDVKTATYATIHQRKDGSKFPIELSVRVIEIEGEKYYQTIGRDITERKNAEEALKTQYSTLHGIIESSAGPVFCIDTRYCYTNFNKSHAAVMKAIYGAEIEIGKSLLEYMTVEVDREKAHHNLDRALAGEQFTEGAYSGEEARSRLYFEVVHNPIYNTEGAIIGVAVFSLDITERKRIEEEIYTSHQMLQLILDNIPQRVFWKDRNYHYLGCNKTFAQDAGLENTEQIIGKDDFQLSWKETAPLYRADDKYVIENNIIKLNYEEPLDKPDGSKMWLRTNKVPLRDRDGNAFGVLGTYEDITEHKRAEEALGESEEIFRNLFEHSAVGISMTGIDGSLHVNKSFSKVVGYTEEELRTKKWMDITHPDDIQQTAEVVQSLLDGKISQARFEKRYIHKNGNTIWTDVSTYLQRDKNGIPQFFITTIADITVRKQVEEKIQQLNEKLEQRVKDRTAELEVANKGLESFAYSISHDLRAPLRGINGWSLALQEDFHEILNEQARQDLDRIRSETQRMEQLIDDLLKLSRVTRTEMEPTSTDLSALAHSIIARMQKMNTDRKINFIIQPGLSAWADTSLLDIALTNLFDNAVKFTSPRSTSQIEFGRTDVDGKPVFFFMITELVLICSMRRIFLEHFNECINYPSFPEQVSALLLCSALFIAMEGVYGQMHM